MANSFVYQDKTINVGDRIIVHQKIEEEGKTRTQLFEGILIAIKNRSENKSITVRKIGANSIGVERIFPVDTPMISNIELKTQGHVRRSKLYYMRERTGRLALRIKEKKQIKTASTTKTTKVPIITKVSKSTKAPKVATKK